MLQCAVRSCDATILQVNIQGGLVKRHVNDVGQQLRRVGIVRRGLRPVFRAEAKAEKAVRLSNASAQQQHAREQQDTPRQKHQDAEQRQPKAGIQRQVP